MSASAEQVTSRQGQPMCPGCGPTAQVLLKCRVCKRPAVDLSVDYMQMRKALQTISALGGNMPDQRLTSATGPNDAVMRGLMYCEARRLALEALGKEGAV